MSIKLTVEREDVEISITKFPAGESLVKIIGDLPDIDSSTGWCPSATIECNFESNEDFINIMLLMDAVQQKYFNPVNFYLMMPYLPYARQDRVCNPGESLSIKVIANLINSLGFKKVVCMDIHSDVGAALINNLEHVSMLECVGDLLESFDPDYTVLVAPDAGSMKKVYEIAKHYHFPHVICGEKRRDTLTGEIKEIKVNAEHLGDKNVLILDDIADGSGTFVGLGEELAKLTRGSINLYVTHGIFSKGLEILSPIFTKVYCTNMMLKDWGERDANGIVEIV